MQPLPPSPTMIPGHFMNRRLWPSIVHFCRSCGGETQIPYRASVFSEPQYCKHCGAVSQGATIRTEQDVAAAQAAMAQQDELAGLFARTMTFSNPTPPPEEPQRPEHFQPSVPQLVDEPKRVYASTHYIPPTSFAQATPQASPEPETRPLTDNEIAALLVRHGIDPHTLFPSQVSLFRNADVEQQQRLLELWRISPPNLGAYDITKEQATWLETTMAREEEVARLRYERAVIEAQGIGSPHQQEISRPSSAPAGSTTAGHAEPYMMSGYELLAQREYEKSLGAENRGYNQATDPVYNNQPGWDKGIESMENGYGAFAAQRENQQVMTGLNGLDEEMVM